MLQSVFRMWIQFIQYCILNWILNELKCEEHNSTNEQTRHCSEVNTQKMKKRIFHASLTLKLVGKSRNTLYFFSTTTSSPIFSLHPVLYPTYAIKRYNLTNKHFSRCNAKISSFFHSPEDFLFEHRLVSSRSYIDVIKFEWLFNDKLGIHKVINQNH